MTPGGLPFRRGFTIIELLVGSIIAAIVAAGAAAAVSHVLKARNSGASRAQATARAMASLERISTDIMSATRDSDLLACRVAVSDGGDGVSARDGLLLVARSSRPLRGIDGIPEGDEFEVQYRIGPLVGEGDALWRRCDTALDEIQDGGGIASAIAERVRSLSVLATDGATWFTKWDSDTDGLPHAVRVEVTATDDSGKFSATRRALISLDRVPVPAQESDAVEAAEEGAS